MPATTQSRQEKIKRHSPLHFEGIFATLVVVMRSALRWGVLTAFGLHNAEFYRSVPAASG